eukprot:3622852-Pyramimonas_sp.AAC.1
MKQGRKDGWKGEGERWSTREISRRRARSRKHVVEPDGQIGRADPSGRVGRWAQAAKSSGWVAEA